MARLSLPGYPSTSCWQRNHTHRNNDYPEAGKHYICWSTVSVLELTVAETSRHKGHLYQYFNSEQECASEMNVLTSPLTTFQLASWRNLRISKKTSSTHLSAPPAAGCWVHKSRWEAADIKNFAGHTRQKLMSSASTISLHRSVLTRLCYLLMATWQLWAAAAPAAHSLPWCALPPRKYTQGKVWEKKSNNFKGKLIISFNSLSPLFLRYNTVKAFHFNTYPAITQK